MKKLLVGGCLILIIAAGGYYLLGTQHASKTFVASSSASDAPRVVTFSGSTKDELCSRRALDIGSVYRVDFGDGQKSGKLKECSDFSEVHTYSNSGVYEGVLVRETYSMNMLTKSEVVSSVSVTVSNP
jgi:hypothetical protein